MKAFLSHSSKDKEIVNAVALELGRQLCLVDDQAFSTSNDFKSSIEISLDASSVFVFFASQKSLESMWVNFEVEEAWFHKLKGSLSKVIVYIIDSSVKNSDLPTWLQRGRITYENSAKVIARDIRYHLDNLLREKQQQYFVGRSQEVEKIEKALIPFDGTTPPHAIFIAGLPGVGRRSLTKNASSQMLNLKKHIEIRIREGDSLQDICALIADHVEPYSNADRFALVIKQIKNLSDEDATNRIINNLRKISEGGELSIFYDEGGLLDSEGYIQQPIQFILRSIASNDSVYLFLISSRRPQKSMTLSIPIVHIDPLQENDIKRLILMLANSVNLNINPTQISELASYVAGYPPSAYFAIQEAKEYGIDLVLSDKERLIKFRDNVFLKHLSKFRLDDVAQSILRLLSYYSPLPLSAIKFALEIEQNKLLETVVQLIDLALVILTEEGYYRIADPVTSAAKSTFGTPSNTASRKVARTLNSLLQMDLSENIHRLELSRVLFSAASLAGDKEVAKNVIHFASDLIELTKKFYHDRRYSDAIECGYMAIEERPDSLTARSYLIRALIQEEKWSDAEDMLNTLRRYAPLREVYFLTGFLDRKRGRIESAIEAYTEAQKSGRRGLDISRELAYCHFLKGNIEHAYKFVNEALERNSGDRYIVDLWALIATSQGDEASARLALNRLELIDKPMYFHHRASRISLSFDELLTARDEAQKAFDSEEYPPFEVLTQLVYCEIELRNTERAADLLQLLDKRFGNTRRDIRIGLRCRLEIARGRFSEALAQNERVGEKGTIFYKKIRRDALEGEIRISGLSDQLRTSYEEELSKLNEELKNVRPEQFIPSEIGNFPL